MQVFHCFKSEGFLMPLRLNREKYQLRLDRTVTLRSPDKWPEVVEKA